MSDDAQISDITARQFPLVQAANGSFAASSAGVRNALALDLRASTLSREEVARELTDLTGRAVTVAMIEAYLAPTKPHRFPAELVGAWCAVTGSVRILEALCEELGLSVATQEDRDYAELGRMEIRRGELMQRLGRLPR